MLISDLCDALLGSLEEHMRPEGIIARQAHQQQAAYAKLLTALESASNAGTLKSLRSFDAILQTTCARGALRIQSEGVALAIQNAVFTTASARGRDGGKGKGFNGARPHHETNGAFVRPP